MFFEHDPVRFWLMTSSSLLILLVRSPGLIWKLLCPSWHMIWQTWIRTLCHPAPGSRNVPWAQTVQRSGKRISRDLRWGVCYSTALHFHITPCAQLACRASTCALPRSSVALIFDISYGLRCATIKDGDNLEMPPSIYTPSVSMRESRLKGGGGTEGGRAVKLRAEG